VSWARSSARNASPQQKRPLAEAAVDKLLAGGVAATITLTARRRRPDPDVRRRARGDLSGIGAAAVAAAGRAPEHAACVDLLHRRRFHPRPGSQHRARGAALLSRPPDRCGTSKKSEPARGSRQVRFTPVAAGARVRQGANYICINVICATRATAQGDRPCGRRPSAAPAAGAAVSPATDTADGSGRAI
jgi:hypothetical protein